MGSQKISNHDYYDYIGDFYSRLDSQNMTLENYDLLKPLQVELQPGLHCDLYRCPYCYGEGQKQMPSYIRAETYIKILDELKNSEAKPLIQFAGINSEPTTHPDIVELVSAVKKRGFIFGMHTKGYRMNEDLRDAFTRDYHDVESFVTLSIDASNSRDYVKIHNLNSKQKDKFGNTSAEYFDKVKNNIRKLYELREKRGSKLRINIAYLLFEQNKIEEHLERVFELFENYCDVLRFSIPQTRNDGMVLDNYLGKDRKSFIERLNEKFSSNPKVRVLTHTHMISHKTTFKKCYAQKFIATVDKAGNVFPCPQVPLKNYEWLIYGNVKETSFLDILNSTNRKKMMDWDVDKDMKCRICDRKDEAINIELNKIL